MEKYLNFVAVCLGGGDFYSIEEAIDIGTYDAVGKITKIMHNLFDETYYTGYRLPSLKCTNIQTIDDGFAIDIENNGHFVSTHVPDIDTEPTNGGGYVLLSDGIEFFKFYFAGGRTKKNGATIAGDGMV